MRLWPIMVEVNERESVSVTTLRSRLSRYGLAPSRRVVRNALNRLVRYGFFESAPNTRSGRRIWWRRRRSA